MVVPRARGGEGHRRTRRARPGVKRSAGPRRSLRKEGPMKWRRAFVAVVALSLIAAACSSDSGGGGGSDSSSGEDVTLNFWLYKEGYGFIDQVVSAFEAANPHIHIDVTNYPETAYGVKMD